MKTPERFNRALKALVKGYFDGTLEKGDCSMCAVGNMVGLADDCFTLPKWRYVFVTNEKGYQHFDLSNYRDGAKDQIDSTGYTPFELARVEKAFESSTEIRGFSYPLHTDQAIDQDQLNGLMAVVDVLCEIDNITDPRPYREMFEGKELSKAS